jgi:hypothetical protein
MTDPYVLLTPGTSPDARRHAGVGVAGTPEGFRVMRNGHGFMGWTSLVFVAYYADKDELLRDLADLHAWVQAKGASRG